MSDSDNSKDTAGEQDPRFHRRGFFSEGFKSLLRPLADIVEQRMQHLDVSQWSDAAGDESSTWSDYEDEMGYDTSGEHEASVEPEPLRPPGALPEDEFLERCTASGHCVQACPVSAIRLVWSGDPRRNGKPAVEPEVQACVLCEDLSCMKACPSGALQPISRNEIRMGLAVVQTEHCLRTRGEDCRICVDKCPVGAQAIEIVYEGGEVSVSPEACTGCGMCEMSCPAEPRAIVVEKDTGGVC